MSEPNKSRRQIAIFLLLLFAFSAVFYSLILIARKLIAGNGLYVSGLMWCPALAAMVTLKVSGRKLSELGWKWPKHASHNLYLQGIFTPLTRKSGNTAWFFDEFGIVLPIVTIVFAIFFWTRRGELQPVVPRPTGQQLPVTG